MWYSNIRKDQGEGTLKEINKRINEGATLLGIGTVTACVEDLEIYHH